MDKRKLWREQEQRVVERWNAAEARYREVHAALQRQEGNGAEAEALKQEIERARADIEAVRRQVARLKVEQWLFYGSATFTTLAQQFGNWVVRSKEDVPQAKAHYTAVLRDMMATLDRHLGENEYLAGNYSVADISVFADVHTHGVKDIGLDTYPNLKRWHDVIAARPAVGRAWGPY